MTPEEIKKLSDYIKENFPQITGWGFKSDQTKFSTGDFHQKIIVHVEEKEFFAHDLDIQVDQLEEKVSAMKVDIDRLNKLEDMVERLGLNPDQYYSRGLLMDYSIAISQVH